MWGEFWSTFGAVGLALLITCTVLNVLASLLLARKSLPMRLQTRIEAIEDAVATGLLQISKIEAQVSTWKAELEGLIEESGNQFERLERKRASAAAAASRADRRAGNGSEGRMPDGASRDERLKWIREEARRKGL